MENQGLGLDLPSLSPPETLSKKGFAELVGVSQARISQMITAGLPLTPAGRIPVAAGRRWIAANVDQNRRRATLADAAPEALTPRARRDKAEADIAMLKAERLAGRLIDRAAVLASIEGQARLERDAWVAWCGPAADALADLTGGDAAAIRAVLDKLVRDQLAHIAKEPTA
jgi:hypothetical protein